MIKIVLKHWIYEKCINVLFNTIDRNFNTPTSSRVKIGKCYSKIIIDYTLYPYATDITDTDRVIQCIYYNCIVTHVDDKYFRYTTNRVDTYDKSDKPRINKYNNDVERCQLIDSIISIYD